MSRTSAFPLQPIPRDLAIAVALALAAWTGSVFMGGFSFDDREAIEANPVVEGSVSPGAAFQRDYWHHRADRGHYRPLSSLTLRADRRIHGQRAFGFHLTNVLLHAAVVLIAGLTLLRLPGGAGLMRGLWVFAAHPVLADSVAWISGRTSMVSALSGCLALLAIAAIPGAKRSAIAGAALLLAGILGKEDALMFALPALLIACGRSRPHARAALVGMACAVLVAGALRFQALGSGSLTPPFALLDQLALQERLVFAGRALLESLKLLVWPFAGPPNYRSVPGFIPSQPPPTWALVGWAPWLLAIIVAGVRRRSLVWLSGAAAALSLLPVLQFIPAGEVFAPRFLYLPLLFGAPALAGLLNFKSSRIALSIALVLIVGAWVRSGVYRDRASYARATLAHAPHDLGAWNDLGLALEEQGDPKGAREAWLHVTTLDPDYSRAWSNLGRQALEFQQLELALTALHRAVAVSPTNAVARVNLGSALLRSGDAQAAIQAYEEATRIAPGLAPAWRGLGQALLAAGRSDPARDALQQAALLDPADEATLQLLRRL